PLPASPRSRPRRQQSQGNSRSNRMTMQSGVVFPDGVRLWTDTAYRRGDDRSLAVIGHGPKGFVSLPTMSGLTDLHYAGVISSCGKLPNSAVELIAQSYPMTLARLLE